MDGKNRPDEMDSKCAEGRRELPKGDEEQQPGSISKKCDGLSCNILGAVTVEWCTACDYHDSGCGGFDY